MQNIFGLLTILRLVRRRKLLPVGRYYLGRRFCRWPVSCGSRGKLPSCRGEMFYVEHVTSTSTYFREVYEMRKFWSLLSRPAILSQTQPLASELWVRRKVSSFLTNILNPKIVMKNICLKKVTIFREYIKRKMLNIICSFD